MKTAITLATTAGLIVAAGYLWQSHSLGTAAIAPPSPPNDNLSGHNTLPSHGVPPFATHQTQPTALPSELSDNAVTDNTPPEEPIAIEKPDELILWDIADTTTQVDNNPARIIHSAPQTFSQLKLEQTLDIALPNKTLTARLGSTHNQGPNIEVWKGHIAQGDPIDNIIIVRGKIQTHITVATKEATHTAIIDNETGIGSLIDQADINQGQAAVNDAIPLLPIDAQPPIENQTELTL